MTIANTTFLTSAQLVGDEPPHQPFRVLEVMFAPAWGTVGERLRQLQPQIRFSFQPHRPPVLRG